MEFSRLIILSKRLIVYVYFIKFTSRVVLSLSKLCNVVNSVIKSMIVLKKKVNSYEKLKVFAIYSQDLAIFMLFYTGSFLCWECLIFFSIN